MNYFENHQMQYYKEQVEYNKTNIQIRFVDYRFSQFPAHWHIDAEIIMVTAGAIKVGYNFDTYTLYTGDFMLIPGGNIHYFNSLNNGQALLLLLNAETIMSKEEAGPFSKPIIIRNIDVSMFKDIYNRIHNELDNYDKASKIIIKSYLGLISGWILRNSTENTIVKSKQIKSKLLNDSQKLFKYITENYSREITLDNGAKLMHLERNYFCRYFKSLTGTTFARYINIIRIQAAQNMLKATDLPINEIASRCGFETFRTFNREFKTLTGVTAMQYRRNKL